MDDIEKAVSITKRLRSVIMKIVGLEKEKENYDASDLRIQDFFEEADADAGSPAVNFLQMVDTLLYDLMSYDENDKWINQDDYEERTQLKLKEIIERDKQFHLKYILLPTAA